MGSSAWQRHRASRLDFPRLFGSSLWIIVVTAVAAAAVDADLYPIKIGDAYRYDGRIHRINRLGKCNYTFAWVSIPTNSKMAFHAHESACQRLDLGRPNATAAMADISSLDALVGHKDFLATHASRAHCFFVSNRIGEYAIQTLLVYKRGSQTSQIKFDVVDLKNEPGAISPLHVLCVHKACAASEDARSAADQLRLQQRLALERNNSRIIGTQLSETRNRQRDLTLQIVIYQVVCALAAFLALLFGCLALALCIRVRRQPDYLKKLTPSNMYQGHTEPIHSPSYYHMNGKMGITPPSPLIVPEALGETSSMNNIVMTNSSLSACDGQTGAGANGGTYMSYPASHLYSDGSGMVTLVPLVSRPSAALLNCSNGTNSPAAAHIENKFSVSRSGSLSRNAASANYCLRRTFSPKSGCATPQFGSMVASPPISSTPTYLMGPPHTTDSFLRHHDATPIHRFPNEYNPAGSQRGSSTTGETMEERSNLDPMNGLRSNHTSATTTTTINNNNNNSSIGVT